MGEILLPVCGVDDDEEVVGAPVDEHVVYRPPVLIADHRVAGLTGLEPRYVPRYEPLDGFFGVRAAEDDLAHVRDVEEPCGSAYRLMLGLYAFVLHRHLPPGEVHEPGT